MKIKPFKAALGFLTVYFGVVLLLTTSGATSWGIWLFVWQFWPMIFVIFGTAFLMRRWGLSIFFGIPIFLIIFGIMGGGLWLTWENQYFNTNKFAEINDSSITETRISNELPKKAKETEVKILFGESNLKINALENENENFLYKGTHNSNFFTLNERLEMVGSKAKLGLKTSPFFKKLFSPKSVNELSISFSQKPEYFFDLQTGSSDIDLNFENLKVKNLDIDTAASKVAVRFGKGSNSEVKVKSGASAIKFFIPKDSGIRITGKSALTSKNFEDFGLLKRKDAWESRDFDKAKNKIKIEIESGASKVELAE